jgi:hypothetical protein
LKRRAALAIFEIRLYRATIIITLIAGVGVIAGSQPGHVAFHGAPAAPPCRHRLRSRKPSIFATRRRWQVSTVPHVLPIRIDEADRTNARWLEEYVLKKS